MVVISQYCKDYIDMPKQTILATFNTIIRHLDDFILTHYLNESNPDVLMAKLNKHFDPTMSVTESNNLFKLFHLRKPIWELDKLLDKAHDLYGCIVAKGVNVSQYIYYSAIVGIIPPVYTHVRATYKATVWQHTAAGTAPIFDPNVLIMDLHCEFANYRATHNNKGFNKAAT
ncbi:unnamed protein product [Peniophora sp. CBMAI 1063]|nr:unnamed protein product [Peniophora sp. CBMAI 1063]